MLEKLEKIQWTISGLFLLLFTGMFFYPGIPPVAPRILAPVQPVEAKQFESGLDKKGLQEFRKKFLQANVAAKKRAKSQARIEQEYRPVERELYEVAKDLRQAVGQLNLVEAVRDNRRKTIRITKFKPGSYLPELGFQEGDVVELIDGVPLTFDEAEARKLWREKQAEFEAGRPIIVTVNRSGRRKQLIFRLSDFR